MDNNEFQSKKGFSKIHYEKFRNEKIRNQKKRRSHRNKTSRILHFDLSTSFRLPFDYPSTTLRGRLSGRSSAQVAHRNKNAESDAETSSDDIQRFL